LLENQVFEAALNDPGKMRFLHKSNEPVGRKIWYILSNPVAEYKSAMPKLVEIVSIIRTTVMLSNPS
jgi:hypothetical protein